MKKYLIVYQGGTCGNLIAGLIHTLQTNDKVMVMSNGALHGRNPWKFLYKNDLYKKYENDTTNIFTTHEKNIEEFACSNDLTVIKIVYKNESKNLIRKLVTEKSQLSNLKQWYLMLDKAPFDNVDLDNISHDPRVIKFLYDCMDNLIDNFMKDAAYYHHTVNFEDIWSDNTNLLNQLSKITDLKINESSLQLIQSYVTINNRLYRNV